MLMGLELKAKDLFPEVVLVKENELQNLNIKLTVWKIKQAHRSCKSREFLKCEHQNLTEKDNFQVTGQHGGVYINPSQL